MPTTHGTYRSVVRLRVPWYYWQGDRKGPPYRFRISGVMALIVGWSMYRRRQPGWPLYGLLTFFVFPVGLIAAVVAIIVHPRVHQSMASEGATSRTTKR